MRADEMREMSEADLRSRIAELEEERFRLKFRSATESLEEPLRLRAVRKDVARLQTVLRERQLGAPQVAPETKKKKTPAKRSRRSAAR